MPSSKGGVQPAKPDYIKWLLLAGLVAVVAAFAYYAYNRYHPKVNVDRYPVRGIDVSRHNGHIDWQRVADSGVRFVYVKATEGGTYRNPLLNEQYNGARQVGLKVGCYHFFRKSGGGAQQAAHFLRTIGRRHLDLPLVIDVEDADNDKGVDNATVVKQLKIMIDSLEQHGHKVMIYTNGNGYKAFYQGHYEAYDLWLSSFKAPESIARLGHRLQQYSHWGTVDGVDGDVDMNVFLGTEREWKRWLEQF